MYDPKHTKIHPPLHIDTCSDPQIRLNILKNTLWLVLEQQLNVFTPRQQTSRERRRVEERMSTSKPKFIPRLVLPHPQTNEPSPVFSPTLQSQLLRCNRISSLRDHMPVGTQSMSTSRPNFILRLILPQPQTHKPSTVLYKILCGQFLSSSRTSSLRDHVTGGSEDIPASGHQNSSST